MSGVRASEVMRPDLAYVIFIFCLRKNYNTAALMRTNKNYLKNNPLNILFNITDRI